MQNVNSVIPSLEQTTFIFRKHNHAKGSRFTGDVEMEFDLENCPSLKMTSLGVFLAEAHCLFFCSISRK